MKLYDPDGNQISASDMNVPSSSSNTIKHATNRNLGLFLNGIDELEFQLYLDDPMAYEIRRLHSYVKVWRTVYNDSGAAIYSDSQPCFAGVVGTTIKNGESNLMTVKVFSPFWRLQFRFHILNHYLKINIDTSLEYKQSELMWKLIDLVNNAFGIEDSNTGIVKGTFSSANDPVVAPFFVGKGSNTYVNIFDTIMNRPGGVDIFPSYYHSDGSPTLMYFNTEEKRGDDISSSVSFNYHTDSSNLNDLTELEQPIPNEFGNYLWAVGAGGPNSGKVAMEENISDDDDGYSTIGIYMRRADFPDVKRIGVSIPKPTHLRAIAEAEFAQSRVPKTSYEASVSSVGGIHYAKDFLLGDVISLNASKGALSVSGVKQRIYDVKLSNSDNNIETSVATISKDFTGKVAV
jgi:hypothetical protein